MAKAILMSIKPEWVAKILNGEKTIEIRKRFPKDYVSWVYIYVIKALPHLAHTIDGDYDVYDETQWEEDFLDFNGKVVARFWCDKVEKFDRIMIDFEREDLKQNACISQLELDNYIKDNIGYAIHITKLEIFNKPKELSEFKVWGIDYPTGIVEPLHDCSVYYKKKLKPLTRSPQSWCYVEV